MDRDIFAVLHPLRVRWNECDMHGIVFNVNYFLYFDIAMYEWQCGVGAAGDRPDFLTVHAECDFIRPARFNDDLEIALRCTDIGIKSINMEAAVFRNAQLLARGKMTYVHVVKGTTATSAMTPALTDRIAAFEKVAPARTFQVVGV